MTTANNNNTTTSLGVTMALPSGTLTTLESRRADELRLRNKKEQKEKAEDPTSVTLSSASASASTSVEAPPPRRRFAPQRKKKVVVTTTTTADTHHLPIDISQTSNKLDIISSNAAAAADDDDDNDDGGDAYGNNYDEYSEGIKKITTNVADWTTLPRIAPSASTLIVEEEEEESVEEKEYHGEIESIDSNNSNDSDSIHQEEQGQDDDDDDVHAFKIITEQDIPLNGPPPTSTPLVLVNLEALCGCPPGDRAEKEILVQQLLEALLGSSIKDMDGGDKGNGNSEDKSSESNSSSSSSKLNLALLGDGFSLDFNERVNELFESGVASHVNSLCPVAISCLAEEEEKEAAILTEETKEKKAASVVPYTIVPYPEFLSEQQSQQQQQQHQSFSNKTRSTIRLWKVIQTIPTSHPQISSLLSQIFTHLQNTSQSLIWKADMHHQLSLIARSEYKLWQEQEQQRDYMEWKTSVRSERLEKLYEVRETFSLRVDVAKRKYETCVIEREERVECELRRRGILTKDFGREELFCNNDGLISGGGNGNGGFLGGSSSAIPEEEEYGYDDDEDGWGGTIHEDDIIGEESSYDKRQFLAAEIECVRHEKEDVEVENNDEWSPLDMTKTDPLGMNIVLDGVDDVETKDPEKDSSPTKVDEQAIAKKVITNKLEPISHDDNIKRKSQRAQKKQELVTAAAASPDNKKQQPSSNKQHSKKNGESLKKEQESIREMLKSNEERIAEATYLKIQERLQHVDDLLETLQEEEWADDEEQGEDDCQGRRGGRLLLQDDEKDEQKPAGPMEEATLLDQILAMILGALPKDMNAAGETIMSDQEHYNYIKMEHKSIVKEWLEVFGRLPLFPVDEPEEEEKEERQQVVDDGGMPFGDGFSSTVESLQTMNQYTEATTIGGSSEPSKNKNVDLEFLGNEDSNWDEVEDWDALLP